MEYKLEICSKILKRVERNSTRIKDRSPQIDGLEWSLLTRLDVSSSL